MFDRHLPWIIGAVFDFSVASGCHSDNVTADARAPANDVPNASRDATLANQNTGKAPNLADATLPFDATPSAGGTTDGGLAVWTQHNNNLRSGANLLETVLTTSSVRPDRFGLLFSRLVDGQIYAQPLYLTGVVIPGRGARNVVYVATQHNSVYAFDADDPAVAEPYWHKNLGPSVSAEDIGDPAPCPDIRPEIGVTATPVIDVRTGTLYVNAKTHESDGYHHRLHALDVATGEEKLNGPVEIQAAVAGSGYDAENGIVRFSPFRQHNRPGILLSQGVVYLAFGSHCIRDFYHGWVLAYDAMTLQQLAAYNDTRHSAHGGIWMAGQGPASDESGDVYVMTGDGPYDPAHNPPSLGDSFIRLRARTLEVVDYFTPYNAARLYEQDRDLGASGPLLIPETNLVLGGGKQGVLYLLDRNNLGRFHDGSDSQIVQRFPATLLATGSNDDWNHIHGAPVYWHSPQGPRIYLWAEEDHVRAWRFTGSRIEMDPVLGTRLASNGMPGGVLSISANNAVPGSGILWASLPLNGDANQFIVPGLLIAMDASDVTRELWHSEMTPERDRVGLYAKFSAPTVANGRVYLPTLSNQLRIYGLFESR